MEHSSIVTSTYDKANILLQEGQALLNKSYLTELGDAKALLPFSFNINTNVALDVRIFKLDRIVLDNKQSALESLTALYTTLGFAGYTVFLLLKSDGSKTDVYLGVKSNKQQGCASGQVGGDLLEKSLSGHFMGTQAFCVDSKVKHDLINELTTENHKNYNEITSVTGVPSLSVEEREHFIQGLEHFIDAAEGQVYQALILGEPVNRDQVSQIQSGYEKIATQLSPLLKQSISYGKNESDSVSNTLTQSISESFGESLALTQTKGSSATVTKGINKSNTLSHTVGTSKSESISKSKSSSRNVGVSIMLANASSSKSSSESHTESFSTNESKTFGETKGYSSSNSYGKTESVGNTHSTTKNKQEGQSNSLAQSKMQGSSVQFNIEYLDKTIEQMIKKADHQLERLDEIKRYGGWQSAAYFICDNKAQSQSLASIFLGLMRGNDSNSEDFALTTWKNEDKIMLWLKNLSHPRLATDFGNQLSINYLTPATLVSSKELAMQLNLPRRSTSTVSVIEAKVFGRQIHQNNLNSDDKYVKLGKIWHLWKEMPQQVNLDIKNLAMHTFVTGSTGSGKSNTIYQLVDQLSQNDVNFMIIEPAKGEYKNVLGHRDDVLVLGTNKLYSELLRINPFKFPKEVHVLEHIDRLVEIFNVCWPMYAAMPAVLKDAMLNAYTNCGWDLDESYNRYNENLFPSFIDLLDALKQVINESEFSQEVKSNYIGSLVTRVKSLTNGLNGQIFSSDEIDNEILFDKNVIVDLSRIGSQETKSLIMGILIMRLSEHRMATTVEMNTALKHVTVLEEAHNILKRTSTEQSSEGSNMTGKSVEMLSNAIAEMRTFGEGFIIADQSPSAVDISAIRNTNTKIIMRLPDDQDRQAVGRAAAMDEDQIEEIARFPKGVAAIYQNDWLEPVLCKIEHFKTDEKPYCYQGVKNKAVDRKQFNTELAKFLYQNKFENRESIDLNILKQVTLIPELPAKSKSDFLALIEEFERTHKFNDFLQLNEYLMHFLQVTPKQWEEILENKINVYFKDLPSGLEKSLKNQW